MKRATTLSVLLIRLDDANNIDEFNRCQEAFENYKKMIGWKPPSKFSFIKSCVTKDILLVQKIFDGYKKDLTLVEDTFLENHETSKSMRLSRSESSEGA